MKEYRVIDIILAFSVTVMIIGILIVAFSQDNTPANDAGILTVIISFSVTAICQIIIWVKRKRK